MPVILDLNHSPSIGESVSDTLNMLIDGALQREHAQKPERAYLPMVTLTFTTRV